MNMRTPFLLSAVSLLLACAESKAHDVSIVEVFRWHEECSSVGEREEIATGQYDAFCGNPYNVLASISYIRRPNRGGLSDPPESLMLAGAGIRLQNTDGEDIVTPFQTYTEGVIFPRDEHESGVGMSKVEVIPQDYVEDVRGYSGEKLVASIRLHGTTINGVDIETDEFSFPIAVCSGCLAFIGEGEGCAVASERESDINELPICQDHCGYDGVYCFCSSASVESCDPCPIQN